MRTQTHDPYRSQQVHLPELATVGWDGPVSVLAHVDRYPPFVNAGAEWMLHAMLRHLVDAGHEVHVSTAVREPAVVDGVQVWPAEYARSLAADADVLVGHLLWTREAVTLAHLNRLPLLYLVHNDFQVRFWRLQPADVTCLVQNAEWVYERHTEQFPSWSGPSIVVRPPCRLQDYRVPRPDARFITLVNLNADKGADTFYEVARRMPHHQFLAVGGAYGKQIDPPADLRNVTYQPPTGNISRDVYARTRILMVPSRYESWGRVAVEALCSGIPVLAHPTPGLRESCGEAAIFCDRDDTDAWCDAITALDDEQVYGYRSGGATMRAAIMTRASERDLTGWEQLVRRAAAPVIARRIKP